MTVRCKGVARWLSGGKRPSHPIFSLSKKGVGIIDEEKNFIIVIGICPYLTKSLRWNWRIERTRTGVGCQKRWPIRTLEWTKWCTICYTTERS